MPSWLWDTCGPTRKALSSGFEVRRFPPLTPLVREISKLQIEPLFARLTPTFAGLYQVNVAIAADSPAGLIDMIVAAGAAVRNTLPLDVQ